MPETRRTDEIVESEIGGVPYLALHVSEAQGTCGDLADSLTDDGRVSAEFVEMLRAVAGYEVRL